MPGKLNEQHVRKTAITLGIPADFVRKDFYVTRAIKTLTNVQDAYFALIFQGGTSLSKGHKQSVARRVNAHASKLLQNRIKLWIIAHGLLRMKREH